MIILARPQNMSLQACNADSNVYVIQEQYVFVYKALAEWFTFGETDIEMDRIHDHVKRLHEPAPDPDLHINPAITRAHFSPRANKNVSSQRKAISYEYRVGCRCHFDLIQL